MVTGGFGGRTETTSGPDDGSAVVDDLLASRPEVGKGGNGWSPVVMVGFVGSFSEVCPFPKPADFSVGTFSLERRVTIFGFAAAVCSEYGVPPMVSSGISLDSPVLDSAALFSTFTAGVGCRPLFACSTLAFFGGTAGSLTSGFFASSCAPQQPSNDRNLETPRFLGFSGLDAACKLGPAFSCPATPAVVKFSFKRRTLRRLPLRRFPLMLSFEPFLEIVFGSETTPWAGADVKVCVCRLDEVRMGTPGAEHSSDNGAVVMSWDLVTPLSITGLSSSRLTIAAASPDGKCSCADEKDVGLVGRDVST